MRSRSFFSYAVFSIGFITLGAPGGQAAPGYRVSGPFTHDNLSLYFVHGEADKGPVGADQARACGKESVTSQVSGGTRCDNHNNYPHCPPPSARA